MDCHRKVKCRNAVRRLKVGEEQQEQSTGAAAMIISNDVDGDDLRKPGHRKVIRRKRARGLKAGTDAQKQPMGSTASVLSDNVEPVDLKRKKKRKVPSGAEPKAEAQKQDVDSRGVIHLATLPSFMGPEKLRHLMEPYGEVGRIFLQPEDKTERERRKRAGGNKKQQYSEGWVEFMDKRVAKRVALTLNTTSVGGKKRHNFYRDKLWNMRYLSKFKWHMLKEQAIYNRQVRKARLEQKISQATRENDFFLEQREKAKSQRRAAARREMAGPSLGRMDSRFGTSKSRMRQGPEATPEEDISDRVLASLL